MADKLSAAFVGLCVLFGLSHQVSNAIASDEATECRRLSQIALADALSKGDISAAAREQSNYASCSALGNGLPRFEYPKYVGPKVLYNASLNLERAILTKHNFATLDLWGRQATHSNFAGSNFSFCSCKNMSFKASNLSSTNFTKADLLNSNLSEANISNSNFSFSSSKQVSFNGSNLSNTNFTKANLFRANLKNANLSNANLSDAFLFQVSSGRIRGIPRKLPQGYSMQSGFILGPGVDLSYSDLRKTNLRGLDLSFVNLDHANLDGVSLEGVNLSNAWGASGIKGVPSKLPKNYKIINGTLVGPKLKSITGNLAGLNIQGMDLSDANLSYVSSGDITGKPKKLPAGWMLVNGYLFGPNAQLQNAKLSGADLTGANLNNADLGNADLSGANLTNTNLKGVRLTDAVLTGANLQGAEITHCQCWRIISGQITGVPSKLDSRFKLDNGYFLEKAGNY